MRLPAAVLLVTDWVGCRGAAAQAPAAAPAPHMCAIQTAAQHPGHMGGQGDHGHQGVDAHQVLQAPAGRAGGGGGGRHTAQLAGRAAGKDGLWGWVTCRLLAAALAEAVAHRRVLLHAGPQHGLLVRGRAPGGADLSSMLPGSWNSMTTRRGWACLRNSSTYLMLNSGDRKMATSACSRHTAAGAGEHAGSGREPLAAQRHLLPRWSSSAPQPPPAAVRAQPATVNPLRCNARRSLAAPARCPACSRRP